MKDPGGKIDEEQIIVPDLEVDEEKQVIVHCKCNSRNDDV